MVCRRVDVDDVRGLRITAKRWIHGGPCADLWSRMGVQAQARIVNRDNAHEDLEGLKVGDPVWAKVLGKWRAGSVRHYTPERTSDMGITVECSGQLVVVAWDADELRRRDPRDGAGPP